MTTPTKHDLSPMMLMHQALRRDAETVARLTRPSHEEGDAVPLVDQAVSAEQWEQFGTVHRNRVGDRS